MLPSTGYFKAINCPFYDNGYCERPYCHFRHTRRDGASTSTAVTSAQISTTSLVVSKPKKAETSISTASPDTIEQLVSAAVKKVLADQNVTDTENIVNKVVEGLKPKLVPAVLSTTPVTNAVLNPPTSVSEKHIGLPVVPTIASPTDSCEYNPTPISELRKRHIPIPSYQPARESKAVKRKSPEVELPWMDVIRNVGSKKESKVYRPTTIDQSLRRERSPVHSYVPSIRTDNSYNRYDANNGSDEAYSHGRRKKKKKKDSYHPKPKKRREEYVPRRPKVPLKDKQNLDDDDDIFKDIFFSSEANSNAVTGAESSNLMEVDPIFSDDEDVAFVDDSTRQQNTQELITRIIQDQRGRIESKIISEVNNVLNSGKLYKSADYSKKETEDVSSSINKLLEKNMMDEAGHSKSKDSKGSKNDEDTKHSKHKEEEEAKHKSAEDDLKNIRTKEEDLKQSRSKESENTQSKNKDENVKLNKSKDEGSKHSKSKDEDSKHSKSKDEDFKHSKSKDEDSKHSKSKDEDSKHSRSKEESKSSKSKEKDREGKRDKDREIERSTDRDKHKYSSKSDDKERSSSKDSRGKDRDREKDKNKDVQSNKDRSHHSKKDSKSDKDKNSDVKSSRDDKKDTKHKSDDKSRHKSKSTSTDSRSKSSTHKSSDRPGSHSSQISSKSSDKTSEDSEEDSSDTDEEKSERGGGGGDSPEFEEFSPFYDEQLLEDSDSDHDVEEECRKIFQEYEVSDHPKEATSKAPAKAEVEESEEIAKKRVAHAGAAESITKPVGPSQPVKRLANPQQRMYERWRLIREIAAEKAAERAASSKETETKSSKVSETKSSKVSETEPIKASGTKSLAKKSVESTSKGPQVNGNGRVRIAGVPYAMSLALEKKKVLEKVAKVETKTVAQNKKGSARVAHVPQVIPQLIRPEPLQITGTQKFPINVRQFYVNAMQDICIQIYDNAVDAAQRAVREELACYERCKAVNVYKNSCMLTVHRLRKEVEQKSEETTTSYGTISHEAVLAGKVKGSWSIVKQKRPSIDVKGTALYNKLSKWILSEQELKDNGYPRPHPDGPKGRAKLYVTNKRGQSNPSKVPNQRFCCRCNKSFMVDKHGLSLKKENCIYHYARKFTFRGETKYMCCKQDGSSDGCCDASTHVWDLIDLDNLRGYVSTFDKDNVSDEEQGVYALDCEMCYTTQGLELTRVTVIDDNLKVVYETLVKPTHPIIDYNTRFSGISEEDMRNVTTTLLDVQATFLSMFSSKTILIGHSLESDFKALKLLHKTVVDTSVMFPHKNGPPFKRALKNLVSDYLRRIIQNDLGGHDSKEDALACMELVLWKVKEEAKLQ